MYINIDLLLSLYILFDIIGSFPVSDTSIILSLLFIEVEKRQNDACVACRKAANIIYVSNTNKLYITYNAYFTKENKGKYVYKLKIIKKSIYNFT